MPWFADYRALRPGKCICKRIDTFAIQGNIKEQLRQTIKSQLKIDDTNTVAQETKGNRKNTSKLNECLSRQNER